SRRWILWIVKIHRQRARIGRAVFDVPPYGHFFHAWNFVDHQFLRYVFLLILFAHCQLSFVALACGHSLPGSYYKKTRAPIAKQLSKNIGEGVRIGLSPAVRPPRADPSASY